MHMRALSRPCQAFPLDQGNTGLIAMLRAGGGYPVLAALFIAMALAYCAGARAQDGGAALVIGNSRYESLPAIESARTDTQQMALALQAAGFKVLRAGDVDKTIFDALLGKFEGLLNPEGTSVFYYAGHSVQISGENHIIPVDVALADGVASETINISDILARMRAKSKRSILILDACRSLPGLSKDGGTLSPGCAKQSVSAGMLVILAAEPGDPLAQDSLLAPSFIARAFKPGKDISAALAEVRQDIIDKSKGGQVIYYNSALEESEFTLNSTSKAEPTEPVQPNPPPQPTGPVTPPPTETGGTQGDCASLCPEMVSILAGSFEMGNASGESDEKPVHQVSIQAFSLGRYEVSIGEWRKCVTDGKCRDPGKAQASNAGDIPVYNVTWEDAVAYANWLSGVTGKHYRLPTEAEWEYAARAGTSFAFSGGSDPSPDIVDCKDCGAEGKRPAPHGRGLAPNAFGLSGMSGGVAEWVMDCWLPNYGKHRSDGTAVEVANCSKRVLRGGSWRDDRKHVTVTKRAYYDQDVPYPNNGLRVARDN